MIPLPRPDDAGDRRRFLSAGRQQDAAVGIVGQQVEQPVGPLAHVAQALAQWLQHALLATCASGGHPMHPRRVVQRIGAWLPVVASRDATCASMPEEAF